MVVELSFSPTTKFHRLLHWRRPITRRTIIGDLYADLSSCLFLARLRGISHASNGKIVSNGRATKSPTRKRNGFYLLFLVCTSSALARSRFSPPSIYGARLYTGTSLPTSFFAFFFCFAYYSHITTTNNNNNSSSSRRGKMKRALVSLVRQRALACGAESAKVSSASRGYTWTSTLTRLISVPR